VYIEVTELKVNLSACTVYEMYFCVIDVIQNIQNY